MQVIQEYLTIPNKIALKSQVLYNSSHSYYHSLLHYSSLIPFLHYITGFTVTPNFLTSQFTVGTSLPLSPHLLLHNIGVTTLSSLTVTPSLPLTRSGVTINSLNCNSTTLSPSSNVVCQFEGIQVDANAPPSNPNSQTPAFVFTFVTSQGARVDVNYWMNIVPVKPVIRSNPTVLSSSMVKYNQTSIQFEVSNEGSVSVDLQVTN